MLYFELKRYENYLKTHCNLNVNKYVYQASLIKNDVQFFTRSANLQDRCLSYRDIYDYNSIRDFVACHFGVSSILESYRINNSYSHRVCRLRRRINDILSSPCIFVTFTFTDKYLFYKFDTRRKYVLRFLEKYSSNFVANVDYGSENGREHYHAVIQCDSINSSDWPYGLINFERVSSSSDPLILSKYVSKLTNHAIKESTKRRAVIYSKLKKDFI